MFGGNTLIVPHYYNITFHILICSHLLPCLLIFLHLLPQFSPNSHSLQQNTPCALVHGRILLAFALNFANFTFCALINSLLACSFLSSIIPIVLFFLSAKMLVHKCYGVVKAYQHFFTFDALTPLA